MLDVAGQRLEHDDCVRVDRATVVVLYHPHMLSSVHSEAGELGKSEQRGACAVRILVCERDDESGHGVLCARVSLLY